MACGCVPVVTDRGALPEVVENTGIVVPYGDVDATIKAIHIALSMDGSSARERAKFFIKEKRLQMLSDILENNYLPLVSIVIPSYNSAQWLPDTIGSILNQTYKNIEIIVVDDCSNDNTYEVVSKFKNVKYIKNEINMGECYTSCRGFEQSSGDYICRLSSDDMYANPDKIKHQVEIMEKTGADWSYNSINCVGETLETSKTHRYYWLVIPTRYGHLILQLFDNYILKFPYLAFMRLFFGNPVNSSTLMIKKLSYMKSAKWASGKQRTDCDGLLLYNLFLKRFKCVAICELGVFYRIHSNQMSYAPNYLQAVRSNKLEAINKVLNGDYPIWLKFMVKIIRRKI
jgi:glycosyltransferase involved in cell wall biosynthesis